MGQKARWDPRLKPAYPFADASHIVRVPQSTLRAWFNGQKGTVPVLAPDGDGYLSFANLVEAHALAAIRKKFKISLQKTRKAVEYLAKNMALERPLQSRRLSTDGIEIYVRAFEREVAVSAGGQLGLEPIISLYLHRIEWGSDDLAVRLFPFVGPPETTASRAIEVNPAVCFGRPFIAGARVPVDVILDRWDAGESRRELAEDYRVEEEKIDDAIAFARRKVA